MGSGDSVMWDQWIVWWWDQRIVLVGSADSVVWDQWIVWWWDQGIVWWWDQRIVCGGKMFTVLVMHHS